MGITLCYRGANELLASLTIAPTLVSRIKEAQQEDGELWAILQKAKDDLQSNFRVNDKGIIWFSNRLCVPDNPELKKAVMSESYNSLFSIHPGSTKMYRDLKQYFWWNGLPKNQRRPDAIWVVVDRLTKSAHFLPIQETYPVSKLSDLFQREIVRLHGTPVSITSDRDPRFTSRF
ncbi:uncharacterized protein LOC112505504 [Cynara cardunculus var. scolymus]|uniref:uncharacterized protein LOC112505504 n=1 Tax=Cynara cardunculus var. scolymus TaxID=59895 RepID=UPI000D62BAC6|nr:uncharacterized protein LOC112505504 [Cynara cardunculus var. scolymus]